MKMKINDCITTEENKMIWKKLSETNTYYGKIQTTIRFQIKFAENIKI